MTLLAVYKTPSERKQRRRNKLEVGDPGGSLPCALISQLRQHFFPDFMADFTAQCLGLFIRGRKGGASKIPDEKPSPTTSPADTTSSGDQDSLCPRLPPPPTFRSGVDETFLGVAVNTQVQVLLETLTGLKP